MCDLSKIFIQTLQKIKRGTQTPKSSHSLQNLHNLLTRSHSYWPPALTPTGLSISYNLQLHPVLISTGYPALTPTESQLHPLSHLQKIIPPSISLLPFLCIMVKTFLMFLSSLFYQPFIRDRLFIMSPPVSFHPNIMHSSLHHVSSYKKFNSAPASTHRCQMD